MKYLFDCKIHIINCFVHLWYTISWWLFKISWNIFSNYTSYVFPLRKLTAIHEWCCIYYYLLLMPPLEGIQYSFCAKGYINWVWINLKLEPFLWNQTNQLKIVLHLYLISNYGIVFFILFQACFIYVLFTLTSSKK